VLGLHIDEHVDVGRAVTNVFIAEPSTLIRFGTEWNPFLADELPRGVIEARDRTSRRQVLANMRARWQRFVVCSRLARGVGAGASLGVRSSGKRDLSRVLLLTSVPLSYEVCV